MNILEQAAARKATAEANNSLAAKLDTVNATPDAAKDSDTGSKAIANVVAFVKPAEAPQGAFKALEMKRFVTADGSWVNAEDGYFAPKTQEQYDMLRHYASLYNLVELPNEE